MASLIDRVRWSLPVWAQNLGVTIYGMAWRHRRLGGVFKDEVKRFRAREGYSEEQWHDYMERELQALLVAAYERVPLWRERLSEFGPERLRRFHLEDLTRLEFLDKETLRTAGRQAEREGHWPVLHTYLSSGSTGTPIAVHFSTRMHQVWSATYEVRCRGWAGLSHADSRAMIGGRLVVPPWTNRPPYWRVNYAERQLYMSAFHISPGTAPSYMQALCDFRPDYLVGYASSHFFLARFALEQGLRAPRPKAVLTSSEKLTQEMRETIERVYGCPVFDAWSGVEACSLASECEHHRLHVSPDVGIVEILDTSGRPCPPGVVGEVVCTGLLNRDQPLIRYRIGDMAAWSTRPCPCGRRMPVIEDLVGRVEDVVIGMDGRETVRFHGLFVGLPGIRMGQVVQESLEDITVRVITDEAFSEAAAEEIRTRVRQRLGPVNVCVVPVGELERTSGGKVRAVISKVRRTPWVSNR